MVGRRILNALNSAFVRSVRKPGKYFDGHGLFLRVEENETAYWVQRIAVRGKRTEIGLGPRTLVSLAEAREAALANRKMARAGGDPLQARREAKAIMTFEEAAREVHRLHRPTWKNPKHAAQFIATLETYAFPRMGSLRIPDVTTGHVLAVLTPIWTSKPETAKRVHQRISTVMRWGKAQGWRLDDPAEGVRLALPQQGAAKTPRRALPYSKVAECLGKVKASSASRASQLALEFIVLTAARSGEVRGATWDEVDVEGAVWTIPATRMKGKKQHRVPLSPRALEVLEAARGLDETLIFPGAKMGRPLSENTLSKMLKELKIDADVHGFRTSFRTWAQDETDFPREVAEFALAHVVGDAAERAYARSDLFEKRRGMMGAWSEFLSKTASRVGS